MEKLSLLLFLLSFLLTNAVTASSSTGATAIGITYIPTANSNTSAEQFATALHHCGVTAVRLPEPNPAIVRSFAYYNISILLEVPIHLISTFATNRSAVIDWLYTHVVPFRHISAISVGSSYSADKNLLQAIQNLYISQEAIAINPKISVSAAFSCNEIITNFFPPSSAKFLEPLNKLIINPLLQFLTETDSSFLVKIHPYDVYSENPRLPIGFALFEDHTYNDPVTGLEYHNLFDLMVDAVFTAMAVSGHQNIPVIVTETGWPSDTDRKAIDQNSQAYLRGLFSHLKRGLGTPVRKEGVALVYVLDHGHTQWTMGCADDEIVPLSLARLPQAMAAMDLGGAWNMNIFLGVAFICSLILLLMFGLPTIFNTITFPKNPFGKLKTEQNFSTSTTVSCCGWFAYKKKPKTKLQIVRDPKPAVVEKKQTVDPYYPYKC